MSKMSRMSTEQRQAHEIYNTYGLSKGKDYIMDKLYHSGSSTPWKLIWNEFQKFKD